MIDFEQIKKEVNSVEKIYNDSIKNNNVERQIIILRSYNVTLIRLSKFIENRLFGLEENLKNYYIKEIQKGK